MSIGVAGDGLDDAAADDDDGARREEERLGGGAVLSRAWMLENGSVMAMAANEFDCTVAG